MRYLREKESRGCGTKGETVKRKARKDGDAKEESEKGDVVEDVGVDGEPRENREAVTLQNATPDAKPNRKGGKQEVYVLDGGFVKWQEL